MLNVITLDVFLLASQYFSFSTLLYVVVEFPDPAVVPGPPDPGTGLTRNGSPASLYSHAPDLTILNKISPFMSLYIFAPRCFPHRSYRSLTAPFLHSNPGHRNRVVMYIETTHESGQPMSRFSTVPTTRFGCRDGKYKG